jgi:predicted metalloprotease with PDZ domain
LKLPDRAARLIRRRVILVALLLVPSLMQAADTIRHTIRLPSPETHYAEVEVVVPTGSQASIELMMAVWTPGSYSVRDYSGKMESERAQTLDGRRLAVRKSAKNRWEIETTGQDSVRFSYKLYCREMSVRSNWVEADFAIIVGAATFLTVATENGGFIDAAHEVRLELPDGWAKSHSSMSITDGAYVATDFHELLDSPILAGDLAEYAFDIDGVEHTLVNLGEGAVWNGPKSAADVETIARMEIEFWGSLPYSNYSFLNAITETGGGLEHKNSTLVMTSRWATETREAYLRWMYLISHEFFHTWNVKRLRPVELDDFDYERENYTTGLWVAEGLTSYYDPLLVRRAGLSTRKEYLKELSKEIDTLESSPGRLTQGLSASSFDAWVKFYRRSENTANSVVSYYGKGALVGWLLDAHIRRATNDAKSLDDVMRLAYERYSGDKGYTQEEFRQVISEVAGSDLSDWIAKRVDEPGELSYDEAMEWFGLRFAPPKEEDDEPKAWLGITTRQQGGRVIASRVRRGSPAHVGGINPEDEILAINGYRVPADGLSDRLKAFSPGDDLTVLLSRRERVVSLSVTAGAEPSEDRWKLEVDPEATEEHTRRFDAWLGEELAASTR